MRNESKLVIIGFIIAFLILLYTVFYIITYNPKSYDITAEEAHKIINDAKSIQMLEIDGEKMIFTK